MDGDIRAAHGSVHWQADDHGLRLEVAGRRLRWTWVQVQGAGLGLHPNFRRPNDLPQPAETLLPGIGRLADLSNELAQTHRALVVAHGDPGRRRRAFQVFLPLQDPGTQALAAAIRRGIGSGWVDGEHELLELRRRLGVSYPGWFGPVGFAAFFVVGMALLLPAMAGFVAIAMALDEGRPENIGQIHPISWVAMVAWIVFVGWVLIRLGRLRRRP
ncbi:MAG: hypothetical protein ACRDHD_10095 [Candidatus Limnocylindria bacterium]